MRFIEVNFDGIVGPTHNYSGLAKGNFAATENANKTSNPKRAALQGLKKMCRLMDLGLAQAVIPPLERPCLESLAQLGFRGSYSEVLQKAAEARLLPSFMSSSSMWVANAATITPSPDSEDGKVHITPANLGEKLHRSIESGRTAKILASIFDDQEYFVHHPCLPQHQFFGDEGAANHMRICRSHGEAGVSVFVYGRSALCPSKAKPKESPARQTLEACQAIARQHGAKKPIFLQQNPIAIDAGCFHNDVIATSNESTVLVHEEAYVGEKLIDQLRAADPTLNPRVIVVPKNRVTLSDARESYLFNSQLVSVADGSMTLIADKRCQSNENISLFLSDLASDDSPVDEIFFEDLGESMDNGGGPACLRLRVVLNEKELAATKQSVFLNSSSLQQLEQWVEKHYRDTLAPEDLKDPKLIDENRAALDELTTLLQLGSIYRFQESAVHSTCLRQM